MFSFLYGEFMCSSDASFFLIEAADLIHQDQTYTHVITISKTQYLHSL